MTPQHPAGKPGKPNCGKIQRFRTNHISTIPKGTIQSFAESGLVGRRKAGVHVFYRLDDPIVERLRELVGETILREVREGVVKGAKLLEDWPPPG